MVLLRFAACLRGGGSGRAQGFAQDVEPALVVALLQGEQMAIRKTTEPESIRQAAPIPTFGRVSSKQIVVVPVWTEGRWYGGGPTTGYYKDTYLTPDEADALARDLHDRSAEVRRGWSPNVDS